MDSKFKLGNIVFALKDNKIVFGKIASITHMAKPDMDNAIVSVFYGVEVAGSYVNITFNETDLYSSKEELIASL